MHTFQKTLPRYINGGPFSRIDHIRSCIFPKFFFTKNANYVLRLYDDFKSSQQSNTNEVILNIERYEGENHFVHEMIDYLSINLNQDLVGGYVHGSLGTYEELPYSDFDALVILKEDVFESEKRLSDVAFKLWKAKSIMYQFDPLQHHGWFVLAEINLSNYPEHYFPLELFRYSKSMFTKVGEKLSVQVQPSKTEMIKAFNRFAQNTIDTVQRYYYQQNIYQLKSFLSEFMLLPSLYIQAKEGEGIFKKSSFDLARRDFNPNDWGIMDQVSTMRLEWSYKLPTINRWIMTQPSSTLR